MGQVSGGVQPFLGVGEILAAKTTFDKVKGFKGERRGTPQVARGWEKSRDETLKNRTRHTEECGASKREKKTRSLEKGR